MKIKNRYSGEVIFEYYCDDNTITKTVLAAITNRVPLCQADLRNANLGHADLARVNLAGADLRSANLVFANLTGADLRSANLGSANLAGANLVCANFLGADLINADLGGADLACAYFWGADLGGADLRDAYLRGADLRDAKNVPFIPSYLPVGEFVAWKKCQNKIIKLKILEDSKRSRATSDKCRCDKALVLGFEELDGTPITNITEIVNTDYTECHYKVGEVVYADKWDTDRWNECSHGIHFFIDRQSAVEYY